MAIGLYSIGIRSPAATRPDDASLAAKVASAKVTTEIAATDIAAEVPIAGIAGVPASIIGRRHLARLIRGAGVAARFAASIAGVEHRIRDGRSHECTGQRRQEHRPEPRNSRAPEGSLDRPRLAHLRPGGG